MMIEKEPTRTAIFLHIPKTAGSTLHSICSSLYPADRLLHLKGDPHIDTAVASFKQLHIEAKQQIWLLTGHIDYGLHHWLPQSATYFTILRAPVERVLSYYYFILRTPEHPRYEEMTRQKTSIADFAKNILGHNNQTRFVAGTWLKDEPCTEATYLQAKQHVSQNFTLVGLSEQFDTTMLLLKHKLNWPGLPYYSSQNVTKNRPARRQPDDKTLATIQDTQAFDLRLYSFAQRRFEAKIHKMGFPFWTLRFKHQLRQQAYLYQKKARKISIRDLMRQQWQELRHRQATR